jgi:hypothetical protein
MTLPGILFGILISILLGAVFHLWKDGGFTKLLFFIGLSVLGFWVGHLLGNYLKWYFWSLGQLRFGMGIFGSILFLFLGNWLSLISSGKAK